MKIYEVISLWPKFQEQMLDSFDKIYTFQLFECL